MNVFTADEVRAILRERIRSHYGTQEAAAQAWGTVSTVVSDVVCGRRNPTPRMLADLRLERVITYRRPE